MKQDLIQSPKEPRMQPQPPGELSQSDGELSDFDNEEESKQAAPENTANAASSSTKNLRELARKLWLAVEKGDKMGIMNILQSNDK